MHRQIWRAAVPLLLLAAVCGALWPLRRFLTAEAISRASPEQLWLAAGFLLLLYGVKSVSFCFPMSALTAAGGLLFPYPAALAVNLTGTAVAQTLPFLMGRWNRQWAAGVLSRFPKAGRFLSQEQGREGLLVFLLRLAGASPGDLVSLALGAAGIPPSRYLVPGVLGAAPGWRRPRCWAPPCGTRGAGDSGSLWGSTPPSPACPSPFGISAGASIRPIECQTPGTEAPSQAFFAFGRVFRAPLPHQQKLPGGSVPCSP